ncbi:MAG: hypothetical protein JWM18_2455 [Chloroflexi bacterium]|jgi:hypothetical protein|nr:hypothetical protein [Chloroflexota bacterium]
MSVLVAEEDGRLAVAGVRVTVSVVGLNAVVAALLPHPVRIAPRTVWTAARRAVPMSSSSQSLGRQSLVQSLGQCIRCVAVLRLRGRTCGAVLR